MDSNFARCAVKHTQNGQSLNIVQTERGGFNLHLSISTVLLKTERACTFTSPLPKSNALTSVSKNLLPNNTLYLTKALLN